MEKIQIQQITAGHAAAALRAAGVSDPEGVATPESMAGRGVAFRLATPDGEGVGVLEKLGEVLWVRAFGSVCSRGLTAVAISVTEAMAREAGCLKVAFQTGRPGLVLIGRKHGYRIAQRIGRGYVMEKVLS